MWPCFVLEHVHPNPGGGALPGGGWGWGRFSMSAAFNCLIGVVVNTGSHGFSRTHYVDCWATSRQTFLFCIKERGSPHSTSSMVCFVSCAWLPCTASRMRGGGGDGCARHAWIFSIPTPAGNPACWDAEFGCSVLW